VSVRVRARRAREEGGAQSEVKEKGKTTDRVGRKRRGGGPFKKKKEQASDRLTRRRGC